jgi:hypothetical protein
MTREEIVRYAVNILGTRECREDVEMVLKEIELLWDIYHARPDLTKKGKIAARRLAQALRKVHLALKSDNLDLLLGDAILRDTKLLDWIKRSEEIAGKQLSNRRPPDIEKLIALMAYQLMRTYKRPISTTKRGPFERLAAALSGDLSANFHHQCRAIVDSAKTGSK